MLREDLVLGNIRRQRLGLVLGITRFEQSDELLPFLVVRVDQVLDLEAGARGQRLVVSILEEPLQYLVAEYQVDVLERRLSLWLLIGLLLVNSHLLLAQVHHKTTDHVAKDFNILIVDLHLQVINASLDDATT